MIGNILILIAGVLWGVELIPQIIKTYKTKSVKDVSMLFLLMCITAYTLYLIGVLINKQYIIAIANVLPFINICVMLGFVMRYRK